MLAQAALREGYEHVLTAHTLDDQAETVLFRLARGSGVTGLAGMAYASPLPAGRQGTIFVVRPLLHVAKSRLVATLKAARYRSQRGSEQPRSALCAAAVAALSCRRWRAKASTRAALARLAARMRRAEATIEFAVGAARAALAPDPWRERGPIVFEAARFSDLPAEVGLRLLGRAIAHTGDEGPVELGKLEELYQALRQSRSRLRRTLGRRARSRCAATGWWSNALRRAGTAAGGRQQPLYEIAVLIARISSLPPLVRRAFPWQAAARRLHCL